MTYIKNVFKNNYLFFVSVVIFFIPFFWFANNQIISGGETYTILNPHLWNYVNLFAWNSNFGFGMPNIYQGSQVYYAITNALFSFFPLPIVQKILFGLSFSLSFLVFYYFVEYLFKNNKNYKYAYLIGAIFYSVNPFILMMFPWFPTYSFLFILTPSIIKYIIQYIREGKGLTQIILLSILLSSLSLNISILGITLFLIFIFTLLESVINKVNFKKILIIFFAVLLGNIFWILPLTQTYQSTFGGAIIYPTDFAKESILSSPVLNSMTLTEYYWFNKININGAPYFTYAGYYQLLSQLVLLSLLILIVLSFIKGKNKEINVINKKYILFFLSLFLFGAFLTKGGADPFGLIYKLLLINIKIFGIYRASDIKFPYFEVFSLSFLLSYSIIIFCKNKSKFFDFFKYFYIPVVLLLCALPFILGQIFAVKQKIIIPNYWFEFTSYLDQHSDSGRILILPKNFSPFDSYIWGYTGGWLGCGIVNRDFIGYTLGYGSTIQEKQYFPQINILYDSLESANYQKFSKLLKIYDISYILVRNDFDLESFENIKAYGNNYNFYKNGEANKILNSNLKDKKVFGELTLYKTAINDNLINSDGNQVNFSKINPTKYLVSIKNVKKNFSLNFLESFDDNWVLYINNKEIKNTIANHYLKYNYANAWDIDVDKLCSYNQNCTRNADGSYDLELVIEFWPQRLFYIGLFISGTTLLGCLGYLGYDWVKRRKRRKNGKTQDVKTVKNLDLD
jgi:hypothetical protein